MKKGILLFVVSILVNSILFSNAGFYDSFALLNVNGSGNTFFDLSTATGNTDFNGHSIGTMTPAAHSLILGGQDARQFARKRIFTNYNILRRDGNS